jgi:hypothetical protein
MKKPEPFCEAYLDFEKLTSSLKTVPIKNRESRAIMTG